MVAVLHAGPGAAASRRSAAWVWQLPGFAPMHTDVVRPRDRLRGHAAGGHWPRLLPDHHLTVVRGIPVTTLPRTFFDLAAMPMYAGRLGRILDTVDGRAPSLLASMHAMLPELAKQGRDGISLIRERVLPSTAKRKGQEPSHAGILSPPTGPLPVGCGPVSPLTPRRQNQATDLPPTDQRSAQL